MNSTMDLIKSRRSVRAFEDRPISPELKSELLDAILRSPTAGNMMLYSVIDVTDPEKKKALSQSCDEQPFIARAPLVLVFLADFQRWMDYFAFSGALQQGGPTPRESDLLLAFSDALIAAQTAVLAAESHGLGSCYIGDIMERYEYHRDLLGLPPYAFPATMLVIGYPTAQQRTRTLTERLDRRYVVYENRYRSLERGELAALYGNAGDDRHSTAGDGAPAAPETAQDPAQPSTNYGQQIYRRKFAADYSAEMRRSVALALENWR
ncbi:MAG TPA: nitroreductase family protein [Rectinemataceae bacterium]|nr:nitroreductase family protein [Rectinemataceae bacterium]